MQHLTTFFNNALPLTSSDKSTLGSSLPPPPLSCLPVSSPSTLVLGSFFMPKTCFELPQLNVFPTLCCGTQCFEQILQMGAFDKHSKCMLKCVNGFLGAFGLVCHDHIVQVGLQKNVHIGNELIGMYSKMGRMGAALKVFDQIPVRNIVSWNTLVSGYALNFDCEGAMGMFRIMEAEGLEGNVVTWTSLLSSFARCGRLEETVELFRWMRVRGVGAGGEAVAVVLSVCADLGLEMGRIIHGYVVKGGFENYLFVKNALLSVYGKCGDVKGSSDLFAETEERNIVSWNALITSYAEAGFCDEMLEVFSESENNLMERPNVISWSAVIGAFASKGSGGGGLVSFP